MADRGRKKARSLGIEKFQRGLVQKGFHAFCGVGQRVNKSAQLYGLSDYIPTHAWRRKLPCSSYILGRKP